MLLSVSYDLHQPEQDYRKLWRQIQSLGDAIRCMDSTWLVSSVLDAEAAYALLYQCIDADDSLLVTEVGISIGGWLSEEAGQWISIHHPGR